MWVQDGTWTMAAQAEYAQCEMGTDCTDCARASSAAAACCAAASAAVAPPPVPPPQLRRRRLRHHGRP